MSRVSVFGLLFTNALLLLTRVMVDYRCAIMEQHAIRKIPNTERNSLIRRLLLHRRTIRQRLHQQLRSHQCQETIRTYVSRISVVFVNSVMIELNSFDNAPYVDKNRIKIFVDAFFCTDEWSVSSEFISHSHVFVYQKIVSAYLMLNLESCFWSAVPCLLFHGAFEVFLLCFASSLQCVSAI